MPELFEIFLGRSKRTEHELQETIVHGSLIPSYTHNQFGLGRIHTQGLVKAIPPAKDNGVVRIGVPGRSAVVDAMHSGCDQNPV